MASAGLSNKTFTYALLFLVGAVFLYVFGFSRGLNLVGEASLTRANNQAKITALKKKISDLRALEQQFAARKAQVDALSVAMPAEKGMPEVVTMMETMAARAGVILDNIQPGSSSAEGLLLSLTVRGNYAGLLSLVEIMEKNIRPIRIGPLAIAGGAEELTATFNVVVLYQVSPEELTAPEAAPEEALR